MSINYPCIYHKDGYCLRDPEQPDACVFGPCEDETPSNADRIRIMSDEELAEMFAGMADEVPSDDEQAWLEWLQQPAKEG